MKKSRTIGVLALQGSFAEHLNVLAEIGCRARAVRLPEDLACLDGLIIPGGESTTISKLALRYHLVTPIRQSAQKGLPIWGTCAGLIYLASNIEATEQHSLNLIDITVSRNAFGSQIDSFEVDLEVPVLGPPEFRGIFIRAPLITRIGSEVTILSKLYDGKIVAANQGKILVTAFHPELSGDLRFHRYFADKMV